MEEVGEVGGRRKGEGGKNEALLLVPALQNKKRHYRECNGSDLLYFFSSSSTSTLHGIGRVVPCR